MSLYKGGHSTVVVKDDCAIKFVARSKCKEIIGEACIMTLCKHPGVMPFTSLRDDVHLQLCMPAGKSLHGYGMIDAGTVTQWGCVLLRALAWIHARGVIHCDIKPENIIVVSGTPVLADFGIAMMQNEKYTQGFVQTVYYRAIEVDFAQKQIACASWDVWSMGCVLYEMITCEPLFQSTHDDTSLVCARVFGVSGLVLKSRKERLAGLQKLTRHDIARSLVAHARACMRAPHALARMIAELDTCHWWEMIATCLLADPYRATAAFACETAHACVGMRYNQYPRWHVPTHSMDEMKCLRVDIRAYAGMTVNEFNLAEYIVRKTGANGVVALFIANCVYQQRESASAELIRLEPNVIAMACDVITQLNLNA